MKNDEYEYDNSQADYPIKLKKKNRKEKKVK